jgi:hypothetical protein
MRPDHFMRLVDAHNYNEQKAWIPHRRLLVTLHNMFSEDAIAEKDYMLLPMIDIFKEEQKASNLLKPLSQEEIRQMKIRDGIIKE